MNFGAKNCRFYLLTLIVLQQLAKMVPSAPKARPPAVAPWAHKKVAKKSHKSSKKLKNRKKRETGKSQLGRPAGNDSIRSLLPLHLQNRQVSLLA